MINEKILNAVIKSASNATLSNIIKELVNHISMNYDYNDNKASHILEMLVDDKAIVKVSDVDISYIENNKNLIIYSYDDYDITDITVKNIDNIDCIVRIEYYYRKKESIDTYVKDICPISYIEHPELLKMS